LPDTGRNSTYLSCSDFPSHLYLHAWSGGREARAGIGKWIEFYNQQRPHSSLGGQTPYAIYWNRNDQEQPDWQARFVA